MRSGRGWTRTSNGTPAEGLAAILADPSDRRGLGWVGSGCRPSQPGDHGEVIGRAREIRARPSVRPSY